MCSNDRKCKALQRILHHSQTLLSFHVLRLDTRTVDPEPAIDSKDKHSTCSVPGLSVGTYLDFALPAAVPFSPEEGDPKWPFAVRRISRHIQPFAVFWIQPSLWLFRTRTSGGCPWHTRGKQLDDDPAGSSAVILRCR